MLTTTDILTAVLVFMFSKHPCKEPLPTEIKRWYFAFVEARRSFKELQYITIFQTDKGIDFSPLEKAINELIEKKLLVKKGDSYHFEEKNANIYISNNAKKFIDTGLTSEKLESGRKKYAFVFFWSKKMRIISDFHDYYDSVMKFGMDTTIVYNRQTQTIIPTGNKQKQLQEIMNKMPILSYNYRLTDITARTFLIGFCGKIYPIVSFWKNSKQYFSYNETSTINKLIELDAEYAQKLLQPTKQQRWLFGGKDFSKKNIEWLFSDKNETDNLKKLFFDCQIPIFMVRYKNNDREVEMIINPSLSDIGFFKKMDAFTVFSELDMFMSGVLGQQKQQPDKVSDKLQLLKKGFDNWSFKKLPSKGQKDA